MSSASIASPTLTYSLTLNQVNLGPQANQDLTTMKTSEPVAQSDQESTLDQTYCLVLCKGLHSGVQA